MRRDYGRPNLWWLLTPWRWPTHAGRLIGFYALAYAIGTIFALIFNKNRGLTWLMFAMSMGFIALLVGDWIAFERRIRRLRREQAERHELMLKLSRGEITVEDLTPEQVAERARRRAIALAEFLDLPKEDS